MYINKLRNLLKKKDISQKKLSEGIDFSRTALSQALIRGDMKVSLLVKIAKFLNVPISYFFEDNKDLAGNNQTANGNNNKQIIVNGKKTNVKALSEKIKGLEKEVKYLSEINALLKNKNGIK